MRSSRIGNSRRAASTSNFTRAGVCACAWAASWLMIPPVLVDRQPLEEQVLEVLPQRRDLDALDDVRREGVQQDGARVGVADAARLQVEHLRLVELPDGRAVRALDVVGE